MIRDSLEAGDWTLEAGRWKPVVFVLALAAICSTLMEIGLPPLDRAGSMFAASNPSALKAARRAEPPSPAETSSVFQPDKGKLRISVSGQTVGSEDFEIAQAGSDWVTHSSMSAHAPGGGEIKAAGHLKLAADGSPIHYDWSAEAQKKATGAVEFVNGTAKCSGDFGFAAPLRKDFVFSTPRIAVLDNNLYYQYAVLARLYDSKAGGKQSFPVVIPQDMVPGTISIESLGAHETPAGKYESLRVSTTDLEILLYLDAKGRLMRLEVPSSNVTIERE